MNTHNLFLEFHSKIKLSKDKKEELTRNRIALKNKIVNYFDEKDLKRPLFHPQGSFALNTICNPIEGNDYDLDYGVYFICPRSEREEAQTYQNRVARAVKDHAKDFKVKNTCVRVLYSDGHHIDLPCYWLAAMRGTPYLAHKAKGFVESNPKLFEDWVNERIAQSGGQLRKTIRYFKAWAEFRAHEKGVKLPSGFILTILTCKNFSSNSQDDLAFLKTAKNIQDALLDDFSCDCPTSSTSENLLEKYSKDSVLKELEVLIDCGENARKSTCEKEASKFWIKVFGGRFPLGTPSGNKGGQSIVIPAAVAPPAVAATKPYAPTLKKDDSMSPPGERIFPITFDKEDFKKVTKHFPELKYFDSENLVKGTIKFTSKYQQENGSWKIIPANSSDQRSFMGEYSIKIDLSVLPNPRVYETGGKIKETAKRLGIPLRDLHLVGRDEWCCLDFISTSVPLSHISLSEYILNKVYPYFVWQAYYATFDKLPPCGESPHNAEKAKKEFWRDFPKMKRNELCMCGSGKKAKFCCLRRLKAAGIIN